MSSCALTSKGL